VIEGKPSGTSWRVAVRRATHQIVDKPPVFDDPLALVIIGPEARAQIEANPHAGDSPGWTALRAYLAVRSRVAEDALAAAVRAGVRQYVVLGAGLDTFAYRNTDRTLRVFEVDHPETQAWKRKLLTKFQIAVPDDVTYVPVNFERQDLGEELARTGLDATRPTFFSWLGVTMYLTRDSIRGTLRIVRRLAGGTGGIGTAPSSGWAIASWRVVWRRRASRSEACSSRRNWPRCFATWGSRRSPTWARTASTRSTSPAERTASRFAGAVTWWWRQAASGSHGHIVI
jgi:methyltransferase (TIGR00027 family)